MTVNPAIGSATRARLSTPNKVGLGLCLLLGVADIAGLGALGAPQEGDEPGPPIAILVTCAVLGVITLACVVWTWRTGSRPGARATAASRILSALTTVPAFFVQDVPAALVAVAAVAIVVTVIAVGLTLAPAARDGQG